MVLEWSVVVLRSAYLPPFTKVVAASVLKHGGHSSATESNCFDKYTIRQCQDPMTRVKTPMVSFLFMDL